MLGNVFLGLGVLLVLLYYAFFQDNTETSRKRFLLITWVSISLIMAIRDGSLNYGTDLNNYYRLYMRASETSDLSVFVSGSIMEMGYLVFNWICARVLKWGQFIIVFQAFFCVGLVMRFIKKYAQNVLLPVLGFMGLGIMQFFLTGFRQSIAISLCLFAFDYVVERRPLRFLAVVFFAATIHRTALVFLPVYLMFSMKLNQVTILIDAALMVFMRVTVPFLVQFGNSFFEREYSGVFVGNEMGGFINIILAIGVAICFFVMTGIQDVKGTDQALTHSMILGAGTYALRYLALVIERISFFYSPALFIMLSNTIDYYFRGTSKRILKLLCIIGLLFLVYRRLHNTSFDIFFQR